MYYDAKLFFSGGGDLPGVGEGSMGNVRIPVQYYKFPSVARLSFVPPWLTDRSTQTASGWSYY